MTAPSPEALGTVTPSPLTQEPPLALGLLMDMF